MSLKTAHAAPFVAAMLPNQGDGGGGVCRAARDGVAADDGKGGTRHAARDAVTARGDGEAAADGGTGGTRHATSTCHTAR